MPSKRPKRRKPLPTILKTPIQYTWDSSPEAVAHQTAIVEEVAKRLRAVADYYGVQWEPPRTRRSLGTPGSLALILQMAGDLFPSAFTLVPEGASKKIFWTAARKDELLLIMRHCLGKGMTEREAAEAYCRISDFPPAAGSIVTRFHEAVRWEKSGKPMTTRDRLDLAEDVLDAMHLPKTLPASLPPTKSKSPR